MANPVFIDCPEGEWTKIATNVATGIVHRINTGAQYLQTYKLTGEAAPTLKSDGVKIFTDEEPNREQISASTGIDVYLWCIGDAGRIRVDV